MPEFRNPAQIGAAVAAIRERAGWSQRQLAEALGLDNSAISRLEAGKRGLAAEELYRLSEIFGVDPAEVLLVPEQTPTLLRGNAASDQAIAACLEVLEGAIQDYFSAKALASFL